MKGAQILKIQKPIFPADSPFLVYNEDRSLSAMVEIDELKELDFMKLYVRAKVIGDNMKILSVLPESEYPDW